ncbi:hypothetical protein RQ831_22955 [Roseomonas gilardii]|uniref:Uncharacterized protein n=1 Tax=Roseomonas gilardii TaxID=257708 RepID=A0ABU3MNI5_9PROT|nr:hypothetical protein [Roseomonas gilardii]MDT8333918.1 hypothetical protein [Roseomonas gilardii]
MEAYAIGSIALGRLSNIELDPDAVIQPWLDKSPQIAKLQVVANHDTLKAITAMQDSFTLAFLSLMAERFPLSIKLSQVSVLNRRIRKSAEAVDHFQGLARVELIAANPDQKKLTTIQHIVQFENEQMIRWTREIEEITQELTVQRIKFAMACADKAAEIRLTGASALGLVRKELGFDGDEFMLREMSSESSAAIRGKLEDLFERLQMPPGIIDVAS